MAKAWMFKWPVIMGAGFGFVLSLPYISIANACTCCLSIVLCGFLAAFMGSKEAAAAGVRFDIGSGTIAGLIAGLVFGAVSGIFSSVFGVLMPGPLVSFLEWLRSLIEGLEGVPPETLDQMDAAIEHASNPVFDIVGLVFNLIKSVLLGGVFSTVGGLIGGAVFKKEPPAPAAPASEPPAEEGAD